MDDLTDRLDNAISTAMATLGPGIVARWVLIAEVIAEDDRWLHTIPNDDARWWEVAGLLRSGLDEVTAQHIVEMLRDND